MTTPPEPTPETAAPKARVAGMMQRAMLWNLLNFAFSQGAGIVIFFMIAAQVPPHIFGVIALATIAADYVSMEGRNAAMDAILQVGRYDEKSLSSAFTCFLVITLVIAGGMWLAAPTVGAAVAEPLVADFMPLFGLMMLPVPWLAVMDAIMMRDLRYKEATQRSIVGTLVGGAVGIGLAFSPWLLWALFGQRLVSLIVVTALEYKYTRWAPKLHFDRTSGFDFARRFFALWMISTLIQTISRTTLLVFGLRYDVVTVGLLRATNRISEAVQGPIISPLTNLWFPLMSKVKGDIAGERHVYNSIVRTATFVALPTFAGLAIVADDAVALLLPEQYAGVAPILRATSITLLFIPVLWFNVVALSAMGMNRMSLAYTAIIVASSLSTLVAFHDASPPAALLIMSVPCVMVGIAGNVILNRRLQQTNLEHYGAMIPAVLATLAMSAATYALTASTSAWSVLPRLALCVTAGGATYFGWLFAFHRIWLKDRISLLRGREPVAS